MTINLTDLLYLIININKLKNLIHEYCSDIGDRA